MRRDAGEEGGREFSSKMPRNMSNLPDFPRRPFLYVHLCVYTKSMVPTYRYLLYLWSVDIAMGRTTVGTDRTNVRAATPASRNSGKYQRDNPK